jgi:hypothetical protein
MDEKNHSILERFPEKSHTLALLIAEDPEFRTACEDYDACINALRYWSESKEPEAEIRMNEYNTLVRELEEEIIQVVEAHSSN